MTTVGELLQRARKNAGLELTDISKTTKIREKYLHALEESRWGSLPGVTYIQGFLKAYAETLDLDAEKVLALFRREYKHDEPQQIIPESFIAAPIGRRQLLLTIKRFISKLFT
ncbi:helix-turn-helix domain-containing protein [Candidatus Roizmanbacteria bacterium]|nr:helix-turn-helix domain-containing protein [Candidatus Roizmanbacteria bacterium]